MTKRVDFIVNKGSDFVRVFKFKDCSGETQSLNGYQARMQVRRTPPSTELIDELTTENGRLIISEDRETITLTIPHTVVYPITYRPFGVDNRFVYDLELVSPGDQVSRVMQGEILYIDEVTRDNA